MKSRQQAPKPVKTEEEGYSHLKRQDYEDELEHREFAMFWDSLDLEAGWTPIIKLFLIRLACTLS